MDHAIKHGEPTLDHLCCFCEVSSSIRYNWELLPLSFVPSCLSSLKSLLKTSRSDSHTFVNFEVSSPCVFSNRKNKDKTQGFQWNQQTDKILKKNRKSLGYFWSSPRGNSSIFLYIVLNVNEKKNKSLVFWGFFFCHFVNAVLKLPTVCVLQITSHSRVFCTALVKQHPSAWLAAKIIIPPSALIDCNLFRWVGGQRKWGSKSDLFPSSFSPECLWLFLESS